MWICEQCGEPHQDQFKECWKCVGEEIAKEQAEAAPDPAPLVSSERRLRSRGSMLSLMLRGFIVVLLFGVLFGGVVFGSAVHGAYPLAGSHFEAMVSVGLCVGIPLGITASVVLWVLFPYEPLPSGDDSKERES